jgi:hypothetical protein
MTPIAFDGRTVYAERRRVGAALVVRLPAEECDWLGLYAGQMVRVRTAEGSALYHVMAATDDGPGWRVVRLTAAPRAGS